MNTVSRTTCRGLVTRIVNEAAEYLKTSIPTLATAVEVLEAMEEDLAVFRDRLQAARESLQKANNDVKSTIKVEDYERETESIAEYEDKAITVISRIDQRLKKVRSFIHRHNAPALRTDADLPTSTPFSALKLPKLQLRKFSGDIKEWVPFWEQYKSAVHENVTLNAVDKFNYLHAALTGKAAETISGLTPSQACNDSAISLLQEEFGNTEKIVDQAMQKLLSIQPVTSITDAPGLRRLYNLVISTSRSLSTLNIPSSNYYVMLKSVLVRSLPTELRIAYFRQDSDHNEQSSKDSVAEIITHANDDKSVSSVATVASSEFTGDAQVKALLKFIKREVEALEKALEAKSTTSRNVHAAEVQPTMSKSCKTAIGLFTAGTKGTVCFFCRSSNHPSRECTSNIVLARRKEMLLKDGRCFRCVRKGHSVKGCKDRFLKCKRCGGFHATCMCDLSYNKSKTGSGIASRKDEVVAAGDPSSSLTQSLCVANLCSANVYLQTACALISDPEALTELYVRLILDGGSQISFVRSSVARKLNLPIVGFHNISVVPFGSSQSDPGKMCNRVRMLLRSQHDGEKIMVIEAIKVPDICVDILKVPDASEPLFCKLKLADTPILNCPLEEGISVLLGADQYWNFVTGVNIRLTGNLVAAETILGWTIQGPAPNGRMWERPVALHAGLLQDLHTFWDLETIGIKCENSAISNKFEIQNSVKFKNGRYQISLPWKKNLGPLESNRGNAMSRLKSLVRRLSKNYSKLQEYDAAMQQLITNGYAERVLKEDQGENIYYLPHRPVYRYDKSSTKVRIVLDASSCAVGSTSLNNHLETGENLLPDVLKILLNFRCGRIGLVADIEKAFLQIALDERDRDSHRFYWLSNVCNKGMSCDIVQTYRMTRVTFGVTCSPYLLNATIQHHLDKQSENHVEVCSLLKHGFYMDDLVVSVDSEREAELIYNDANVVLQAAGLPLRKWNSNSLRLRRHVANENFPTMQKVLGIKWYVLSDELSVDVEPVGKIMTTSGYIGTKRNLLQVIAKFFDPFGILGPFLVKFKVLFQQLWRLKIDWDEKIPDEYYQSCEGLYTELPALADLAIPRSVSKEFPVEEYQLHVFADASERAYGAVAYLRTVGIQGKVSVRFLCSKNRVAPLSKAGGKELTLPRLELTAAVIAARLMLYLKQNLRIVISEEWLWTDSRITLYWILGENRRWKPYVAHRVREIRLICNKHRWRHCPGRENPADLLTRGLSATSLLNSSLWLSGPSWLSERSDNWPAADYETTAEETILSTNLLAEICEEDLTNVMLPIEYSPIINADNFSSWTRLLRVTAYVFRFVDLCRKKRASGFYLMAEDLEHAEDYWIRQAQQESFPEEIKKLRSGRGIQVSSKILMLNPFLDSQGFLRVGGRLQSIVEGENQAHPRILSKDSQISRLLVEDAHVKAFHGGASLVLSRLRGKFWIPRGRQLLKTIEKRCTICKILRAKPMSQPFAPLPRDRILDARPFNVTGLDFAGPLYTKDLQGQKRKVYILLFTCASVRAVHLELTDDLSTKSALLALRRFIARRGTPGVIYSDNATTFKRAALEIRKLKEFSNDSNLHDFLGSHGTRWKFIVPRAPWWGGFWERLIRTVKEALKAAIGRASLSKDELHTLLTEIENVVNARPLTYCGDDPLDLTPLTPANFLNLPTTFAPRIDDGNKVSTGELRQRWKDRLRTYYYFRRRWRNEYLCQLRSLHCERRPASSKLSTGDVVILEEKPLPRTFWNLAVIEEVYVGRDGNIRACQIRLAHGKTLKRPVQLLYPLEISS